MCCHCNWFLGDPVTGGTAHVRRNWGYAPEYVDAAWRVLQHNQAEHFVMAVGRMHPPSMFVDRFFAVLGLAAQIHVAADGTLLRPPEASPRFGNPKKAHRWAELAPHVGVDKLVQKLVKGESR